MPSSPKRGDGTGQRIDGFHPDVEVIYASESPSKHTRSKKLTLPFSTSGTATSPDKTDKKNGKPTSSSSTGRFRGNYGKSAASNRNNNGNNSGTNDDNIPTIDINTPGNKNYGTYGKVTINKASNFDLSKAEGRHQGAKGGPKGGAMFLGDLKNGEDAAYKNAQETVTDVESDENPAYREKMEGLMNAPASNPEYDGSAIIQKAVKGSSVDENRTYFETKRWSVKQWHDFKIRIPLRSQSELHDWLENDEVVNKAIEFYAARMVFSFGIPKNLILSILTDFAWINFLMVAEAMALNKITQVIQDVDHGSQVQSHIAHSGIHQQDCRSQYLKEVASLRQINRLSGEAAEAKKSAYEAKMASLIGGEEISFINDKRWLDKSQLEQEYIQELISEKVKMAYQMGKQDLKNDVKDIVKQCVDLESKVAEQEGKIRLLETRNLELEDSLQQKDTMLQALLNPEGGNKNVFAQQVMELQGKIADYQMRVGRLEAELLEKDAIIRQLRNAADAAANANNGVNEDEMNSRIAKLEDQNQQLKQANQQLKQEMVAGEKHMKELEKTISDLKRQLSQAGQGGGADAAMMAQLENDMAFLKQENDELKAKIDQLEMELSMAGAGGGGDELAQKMMMENKLLERELDELRRKLAAQQAEIAALESKKGSKKKGEYYDITITESGDVGVKLYKDNIVCAIDGEVAEQVVRDQVGTGDTIIKIDGKSAKSMSKSERKNLMKAGGKRPLTITLQRGDGADEFIEIDIEQEPVVAQAAEIKDLGLNLDTQGKVTKTETTGWAAQQGLIRGDEILKIDESDFEDSIKGESDKEVVQEKLITQAKVAKKIIIRRSAAPPPVDSESAASSVPASPSSEHLSRRNSRAGEKEWFFPDGHPFTNRNEPRPIRLNGFSGYMFKETDDRFGKIIEPETNKAFKVEKRGAEVERWIFADAQPFDDIQVRKKDGMKLTDSMLNNTDGWSFRDNGDNTGRVTDPAGGSWNAVKQTFQVEQYIPCDQKPLEDAETLVLEHLCPDNVKLNPGMSFKADGKYDMVGTLTDNSSGKVYPVQMARSNPVDVQKQVNNRLTKELEFQRKRADEGDLYAKKLEAAIAELQAKFAELKQCLVKQGVKTSLVDSAMKDSGIAGLLYGARSLRKVYERLYQDAMDRMIRAEDRYGSFYRKTSSNLMATLHTSIASSGLSGTEAGAQATANLEQQVYKEFYASSGFVDVLKKRNRFTLHSASPLGKAQRQRSLSPFNTSAGMQQTDTMKHSPRRSGQLPPPVPDAVLRNMSASKDNFHQPWGGALSGQYQSGGSLAGHHHPNVVQNASAHFNPGGYELGVMGTGVHGGAGGQQLSGPGPNTNSGTWSNQMAQQMSTMSSLDGGHSTAASTQFNPNTSMQFNPNGGAESPQFAGKAGQTHTSSLNMNSTQGALSTMAPSTTLNQSQSQFVPGMQTGMSMGSMNMSVQSMSPPGTLDGGFGSVSVSRMLINTPEVPMSSLHGPLPEMNVRGISREGLRKPVSQSRQSNHSWMNTTGGFSKSSKSPRSRQDSPVFSPRNKSPAASPRQLQMKTPPASGSSPRYLDQSSMSVTSLKKPGFDASSPPGSSSMKMSESSPQLIMHQIPKNSGGKKHNMNTSGSKGGLLSKGLQNNNFLKGTPDQTSHNLQSPHVLPIPHPSQLNQPLFNDCITTNFRATSGAQSSGPYMMGSEPLQTPTKVSNPMLSGAKGGAGPTEFKPQFPGGDGGPVFMQQSGASSNNLRDNTIAAREQRPQGSPNANKKGAKSTTALPSPSPTKGLKRGPQPDSKKNQLMVGNASAKKDTADSSGSNARVPPGLRKSAGGGWTNVAATANVVQNGSVRKKKPGAASSQQAPGPVAFGLGPSNFDFTTMQERPSSSMVDKIFSNGGSSPRDVDGHMTYKRTTHAQARFEKSDGFNSFMGSSDGFAGSSTGFDSDARSKGASENAQIAAATDPSKQPTTPRSPPNGGKYPVKPVLMHVYDGAPEWVRPAFSPNSPVDNSPRSRSPVSPRRRAEGHSPRGQSGHSPRAKSPARALMSNSSGSGMNSMTGHEVWQIRMSSTGMSMTINSLTPAGKDGSGSRTQTAHVVLPQLPKGAVPAKAQAGQKIGSRIKYLAGEPKDE